MKKDAGCRPKAQSFGLEHLLQQRPEDKKKGEKEITERDAVTILEKYHISPNKFQSAYKTFRGYVKEGKTPQEALDKVLDENNQEIRKSKLVISDDGVDTEIILEGNGKIKVTTKV